MTVARDPGPTQDLVAVLQIANLDMAVTMATHIETRADPNGDDDDAE